MGAEGAAREMRGVLVDTREALDVFKSPWDLELIAQSWQGVCRFDDFQARLGISRKVLAQRLKDLVPREGVLVREKYQSRPDRHEYRLTNKGRDLAPVLVAMMTWSERWRLDHPAEKWRLLYARVQEFREPDVGETSRF